VFTPVWRHVTSCLRCGFREGTPAGRAYLERCPYDGLTLEHYETMIDTRQELGALDKVSKRRLPAVIA
jgi:hypothetical protein